MADSFYELLAETGVESQSAKRALYTFLDPRDRVFRPELLLLEPEALQWAWRHLGLFSGAGLTSIVNATPRHEFLSSLTDAALYIENISEEGLDALMLLENFELVHLTKGSKRDELRDLLRDRLMEQVFRSVQTTKDEAELVSQLYRCRQPWLKGFVEQLAKYQYEQHDAVNLLARSNSEEVRRRLSWPISRHILSPTVRYFLLFDSNLQIADAVHSDDVEVNPLLLFRRSGEENWGALPMVFQGDGAGHGTGGIPIFTITETPATGEFLIGKFHDSTWSLGRGTLETSVQWEPTNSERRWRGKLPQVGLRAEGQAENNRRLEGEFCWGEKRIKAWRAADGKSVEWTTTGDTGDDEELQNTKLTEVISEVLRSIGSQGLAL